MLKREHSYNAILASSIAREDIGTEFDRQLRPGLLVKSKL
jgi:hypothetical protein